MKYAYTASPGKASDDKFEIEKLKKGEAELRESDVPDRKAMRVMQGNSLSEFMNPKAGAGRGGQGISLSEFMNPKAGAGRGGQGISLSEFMNPKAGAGRGGQGGPTAKELKEEPMTAGQKQSMEEAKDEEAYQKRKTAPTTKTEMGKGFAKGGSASSRADGCAQRGKTRGKMI